MKRRRSRWNPAVGERIIYVISILPLAALTGCVLYLFLTVSADPTLERVFGR